MQIVLPIECRNPAEITSPDADVDPRITSNQIQSLDVDLTQCRWIRPAAALWCLIYPLLTLRITTNVALYPPRDDELRSFLRSIGLFRLLRQSGVTVNDPNGMEHRRMQVILPLSRFATESDVDNLAETAHDSLRSAGVGAMNIYPSVIDAFAELALNAVQHADSSVDAFGFIDFSRFETGDRFGFGVADGGVGIRRSLARNPRLRSQLVDDRAAIELAVRERVSGTGEATRGIGLHFVTEEMRKPGRRLILHSDRAVLQVRHRAARQPARAVTLFPGTLAYASIPT